MKLTAIRLLLVLAPSLVSCDTRYHLAGEFDGGEGGDAGLTGTGGVPAGGGHGGTVPTPGTGGSATTGGTAVPSGGSSTGGNAGLGGAPAPFALPISAREAVTRVARVLWESPPDAALVALADSGTVTTDRDVRAIARSMLADPRARVGVGHFYRWWLELDRSQFVVKDPALFPEYSSAVGPLIGTETETFGTYVTLDADGRFATLMQASYSFLNQTLAPFYGIAGVTGPELRKVDLDPTRRAGIFTQLFMPTVSATQTDWTSPTRRGAFVGAKMLCQVIVAPPANIMTTIPPGPDPETNRQRITRETFQTPCSVCHKAMDPIGFAYENYDSIGRFRLMDHGFSIDATGSLTVASGSYDFNGAVELAQLLAKLPEAHDCMGTQWLGYMLGRNLADADGPSLNAVHARFEESGLDLRELIAAAASSASFLAPKGGTPCVPGDICNDDLRLSSIHGTCNAAGKCVCAQGFSVNPQTGRCL